MHLWVDPHNGHDSLALQFNVLATNPTLCVAGQNAPNEVLNASGAVLLHQPYPFRTITQAVAYVNSLPPTVSATDPLPHSSSLTQYTWAHAIIHLLPGRYASANAAEQQSAHNQLVANGETFPIELPNRVSIQGTSALDTVIEVSRGEGPAFLIGRSATSRGDHSFISTVSFVGGNPDVVNYAPPPLLPRQYTTAAIAVAQDHPSELRVDDCFFFGNGVGVLVDAEAGEAGHEVHVLNCTFAWNTVGIWSGNALSATATTGASRVMLVNNIFDTTPPPLAELIAPTCGQGTRPFPQRWAEVCTDMAANLIYGPGAMTAFEGIDYSDLRVVTQPSTFKNFNAYETGAGGAKLFDTGAAFPSMLLPATSARSTPPLNPDPGYNISALTGALLQTSGRRGVLFVCDLFRNGYQLGTGTATDKFATAVGCGFDLSPMDFRLAPAVVAGLQLSSPPAVPGVSGMLNPLVDSGFATFPILMENGMTLANHPRTLDLGSDSATWPFDHWSDFTDCEGFGNRREFDHPIYSGSADPIDIGADELDLIIVAGYRYGTRTFTEGVGFTSDPQPQPYAIDNRYVWVLGAPDGLASEPPYGGFLFASENWWATPGPAAYNSAPPPWTPWTAWTPTPQSGYYNPFVVDITPHLLPDTHPYHAVTTSSQWPTNPVWQGCAGHPLQSLHNPFLYLDPTEPLPNPPGVFPAAPLPRFAFLDGITSPWHGHQTAGANYPGWWLFGAGGMLGGADLLMSFGDWCQARVGSPPASVREAHILGDSVGSAATNTWNNVYPHQDPSMTGNNNYVFPTGGAQRISVELMFDFAGEDEGTLFGHDGPSNIQTFMIWRQTGS